jgi:hypothetical protein
MSNLKAPYFLMTKEEIQEYKEQLLSKSVNGKIQYQNRFDDSNFPGVKTIRVYERPDKSCKLNLIAVLVYMYELKQMDDIKDDGITEDIKNQDNSCPQNFKPYYPEDIIENVERAIKMRKL